MTQNVIHPWHQYTKHKRNFLATFPEKYSDYGIVVSNYILYNTLDHIITYYTSKWYAINLLRF